MRVETYSPLAYANLLDFFVVKDAVPKLEKQIQELGEVIQAHKMAHIVGVALLHKHFHLYEGEVLARKVRDNELIIEPTAANSSNITPFVWAFSKVGRSEPFALRPVEFVENSNKTKIYLESASAVEASQEFLADYFETLARQGLANVFGLGLHPGRLFKIKPGETLMENDVANARRLILKPTPISDLGEVSPTQTLWVFKEGISAANAPKPQWCFVHCGVHVPSCQVHCGIHVPSCQVHCGIHVPPVDVVCDACRVNPLWPIAVDGLKRAKEAHLVTAETWQSLVDEAVYTATEYNAIVGLVAAACADCLTKDVFG
ncbi:hypothetical protein [Phenylobacterium sp.]|uniref:hypothetical protein n=1 Tax=Phenylobacterium sp. TaxID=1871053 RepID=UPI0025D4663D|nr:hypothetical protein [Phenylobacterium sp.]